MMNDSIRQMLERYHYHGWQEQSLALREIFQEIALVGLWRAKFFEHAAFYGGTALRIFYDLNRFSEDLDFTLLDPNESFRWDEYGKAIVEELQSYGFSVDIKEKKKTANTAIRSAFLKANTVQELIRIGVNANDLWGVHPESTIRIKVEIDTDPLVPFSVEQHYLRDPIAVPVACVTKADLFTSKIHAALYRAWKGRVKGRDWYDVVWFIRNGTPLNLPLFEKMMIKTGRLKDQVDLTKKSFLELIKERLDSLDIESARKDVVPFLKDFSEVEPWSKEFFGYWLDKIEIQD